MNLTEYAKKELAKKKKKNPKEYERVGKSKPVPISSKKKKK